MAVGGSVGDIHATAQTWGGHAQTAGNQANSVILAAEQMPPSVLIGPWADHLRTFAGEVRAGYAAVQEAYDRVGSMLHTVARAVEEAQEDERSLERAKRAMVEAERAFQQAEKQLQEAERLAAKVPAWQSEVSTLAQRCAQLQPAVEQTTRVYQAAERRFEAADGRRKRVLQSFALLCEEEALIVERAVPQAPAGDFVGVAAVDQLRSDVGALLDLPVLAVSGFATSHLAQVTRAVRSLDASRLDGWAHAVIQRATVKPTPVKHPGGGGVLHGALHVLEVPVKFLGKVGEGALEGTVGLGKELYDLYELFHQPTLPGAAPGVFSPAVGTLIHDAGQGLIHPVRLLDTVFNVPLLEKDPAKWLGALVPTIALAAVTDGVDAATEPATEATAGTVAVGEGEAGADGGVKWTTAVKEKLAGAVKTLQEHADKLDLALLDQAAGPGKLGEEEADASVLLYRSKTLLGAAKPVISTAGYVNTLQSIGSGENDEPGLVPDHWAEIFGEGVGEGVVGK